MLTFYLITEKFIVVIQLFISHTHCEKKILDNIKQDKFCVNYFIKKLNDPY